MERSLPPNPWAVLEQNHTPRIYKKDAMIYWQGSDAREFYYLKSGGARVFISSENGAEKSLTILKPGSIFGEAAFFDGLPRISSAKALEDSEIITVTRQSLLGCIRREPQLALSLLTYLSQTIRMLSAQVDTAIFQQADERIARLLLNLSAGSGEVCMTHEDLAALAGVSRVTVSRILSSFTRRGFLKTSYRGIQILDADGLKNYLDEF